MTQRFRLYRRDKHSKRGEAVYYLDDTHSECWLFLGAGRTKRPPISGSSPKIRRTFATISRDAAAKDFGFGQGGESRASPQWAVTTEPTQPKVKRPAARRVFVQPADWLCCSSVKDP